MNVDDLRAALKGLKGVREVVVRTHDFDFTVVAAYKEGDSRFVINLVNSGANDGADKANVLL